MAGRGKTILVSANPRGKFSEGKVSGALKPGTHVQVKASSGIGDDGRFTYEAYAPGTNGEQRPVIILLEDRFNGNRLHTDAYADGDRCFVYEPEMGDEMNVFKGDVAGTGDDFAMGDLLIPVSGTGKVILTTGTPEMEPWLCLEAIIDPTADVLVHARYTGH